MLQMLLWRIVHFEKMREGLDRVYPLVSVHGIIQEAQWTWQNRKLGGR